jgi:dTDP-4-amino-4,6-dideoxygalactose transaminase
MDEREAQAAARPILAGWVTQGPEVAAFERDFAECVGAAHACAVSSCTAALHLALRAVGVGPEDEVITASHSFIATANSVRYCGATPVFVDIERATFNMNPDLIEAAISRRTRAILCVHQMGMPCNMAEILASRGAIPSLLSRTPPVRLGASCFATARGRISASPTVMLRAFRFTLASWSPRVTAEC